MALSENTASIKFDLPPELKEQISDAADQADLSVAQWLRATARATLGGLGYRQGDGVTRMPAPDIEAGR